MQAFFASILIKVLTDPKVQQWVEKWAEELLSNIIAKQILPIIPVAIGGAVKAGVDDIIDHIPGVTGVVDVDVVKTTEGAVNSIEQVVGSIPVIGDLLKNWGIGG
jgi:hypothetical protein